MRSRPTTGPLTLLVLILPILAACGRDASLSEASAFIPSDTLCQRFGCSGTFVDGIEWSDARGENLFFLTREDIESGPQGEQITRLRGYRFVLLGEDGSRQSWQWSDEAENMCDLGEGLIGNIELTDLNGDGVGEVSWLYNVAGTCDVSPKTRGIVIHTGVGSGALEATGESEDPPLSTIPPPFQSHARKLWKQKGVHLDH